MIRPWKTAVFVTFLCSGCAIGPRYKRPVVQPPAAFKELAENDQWKVAAPSDDLLKGKWWEVFGDPQLNRLEELVSINNQNIKQAEANFRQARSTILANRANLYPSIGSNPAITESRNYRSSLAETWTLPAATSWEPDLWGRIRLTVESATASAQVSAADLENLRLSQQALLAADYFLLSAQDMQMEVLKGTIDTYEKNLQLVMNRYAGGVASRSDISLAQTQLAGARAQFTDQHISRAQNEHAIAMLTGQNPASFTIGPSKIAGPPPAIPVGLPSQLLERRPDIASSERRVAAANAAVGIAEVAYYPRLTLSATPGFLASGITDLFTYATRSWSAGPSLSSTLFDFGRRGAALEGARASYDATVAGYRQVVLTALQQVEDDLAALRYLSEEAVQQQESVMAARESLRLETERYRAGTSSYLNVITTQILTLNAEQAAVTILQRRMTAAVNLVKDLGGGWDASTLPAGPALRSASFAAPQPAKGGSKEAAK